MTAVAEPQSRNTTFRPSANASDTQNGQGCGSGAPAIVAMAVAGEPTGLSAGAGTARNALHEVALASARVERLQWEMDAAEEDLCAALRKASSCTFSASALAQAAGLTPSELSGYLQRQPLAPVNDIQWVLGL